MKKHGKNINLFLMDDDVSGRIKCTINGWTGVVYKIPRTDLELCKDRDHLKQSGVYFLFGTDEHTEESVIYVGQACARKNGEGLLLRLQEHKNNPEKNYWSEAVAITTTDDTFGPTEISYLEHRFCTLAKEAQRCTVKNGNDPSVGHVTEEKESELESFIEYVLVVMGTLGYRAFVPINPSAQHDASVKQKQVFELTRGKSNAKGVQTSDGFLVLAGSEVALSPTPSCPDTAKARREKYAQSIIDGKLSQDILFQTPSGAASFVCLASVNGWTEWKTETGIKLKDYEQNEQQAQTL